MMQQSTTLPKYECQACKHQWHPRIDQRPKRCPECGTRSWDKPETK